MAENELQKLINGIFNHIKEKYGYTDEQALIYLKGYEDCAEEHQQSLEKRGKMLRDTVEELCEAKRLLKAAVEDLNVGHCIKSCETCMNKSGSYCVCYGNYKWRYANEAMKLIRDEPNV